MKQKRQRRSEYNRRYILNLGIITRNEYNQAIFDYGIEFLKELYDESDEWFLFVSTDATFWKWWRAEWKCEEHKLVQIMESHPRFKLSNKDWHESMQATAHMHNTEISFQNYLKTRKNVKLSNNPIRESLPA